MEELREAGVTPAERPIPWADPADLPDVHVDLAALDEDLGAADDDGQDATASRNIRMSVRPIIDAGPGLNFLSVNKERLLIAVLGPLSAPETVQDEVLRKSRQDDRFRAAATVWRKLTTRWIQILPDDVTPELATVVQRISGLPMAERRSKRRTWARPWSSPTPSWPPNPGRR